MYTKPKVIIVYNAKNIWIFLQPLYTWGCLSTFTWISALPSNPQDICNQQELNVQQVCTIHLLHILNIPFENQGFFPNQYH